MEGLGQSNISEFNWHYLYYYLQSIMTNPFEALDISSDEETFQQTAEQKVVKRTHQEKRLYKQAQQQEAAKAASKPAPVVSEPLPERQKENAKVVRHNNKGHDGKPLGEGHYLDRRSGTGRVYISPHSATGPGRKAEAGDRSETSRTNSRRTSTSRRERSPSRRQRLLRGSPKSQSPRRSSPRSQRHPPSRSTTRTRAWR